ncbi:hypothetical protein BHE74_00053015 [Ensete ventricosum]|nr:hypothetical protein BHE74_00053015 [Ensete ventricosum]
MDHPGAVSIDLGAPLDGSDGSNLSLKTTVCVPETYHSAAFCSELSGQSASFASLPRSRSRSPSFFHIASVPQLSRESCSSAGADLPSSCSMDSFFDKIFDDGHTCTHTHTCNPPGPNLSHTHTCFHVHTKILSAPPDETAESVEKSASPKKRPCNNREAVRKYREKKKAHAASLEDEAAHLRAINQQLLKRLQNQAALEAEIARLKCLLVDLRGRIEGEIGSFPYHKPVKGSGDFVSNF